tara:strand:- start:1209 stop:2111 length:903 start_codon:yes stop_codon:yes gene_type:complete
MLRIKLKRGNKIVGDIGAYEDRAQAEKVRDQFNIKAKRRGAVAEIHTENPRRTSSLGYLFANSQEDSQEESEEYSESYDELEEESQIHYLDDEELDEYESEDDHDEPSHVPNSYQNGATEQRTYRNPLDILPIHQPVKQIERPKQPNPRDTIPKRRIRRKRIAPYKLSVQAVMIDDEGYVLIRAPKNRYKGIRWEFYGGTVEGGESLDEALHREIKEETGFDTKLVDFVSDVSLAGTKQKFYLVSPLSEDDDIEMMETDDLYWVSQDEAWEMLGKNKQPYKRELRQVLDKAFTKWRIKNV